MFGSVFAVLYASASRPVPTAAVSAVRPQHAGDPGDDGARRHHGGRPDDGRVRAHGAQCVAPPAAHRTGARTDAGEPGRRPVRIARTMRTTRATHSRTRAAPTSSAATAPKPVTCTGIVWAVPERLPVERGQLGVDEHRTVRRRVGADVQVVELRGVQRRPAAGARQRHPHRRVRRDLDAHRDLLVEVVDDGHRDAPAARGQRDRTRRQQVHLALERRQPRDDRPRVRLSGRRRLPRQAADSARSRARVYVSVTLWLSVSSAVSASSCWCPSRTEPIWAAESSRLRTALG